MVIAKGTWRLEEITPDKALTYLQKTGANRRLEKGRISSYSEQMRNGVWKLTHQGIAFDEHGHLRDGQHRLHAIVASGVTLLMWVYRGMEEDAVLDVDRGRARNDAQMCNIQGVDVSFRDLAILRRLVGARRGLGAQEVLDLLERFKKPMNFLHEHYGSIIGSRLGNSHIMTAVCRAWYKPSHRERLIDFAKALGTGEYGNYQEDSAALKLREMVLSMRGTRATADTELYEKTEYALQAFLSRTPIKRLRAAREELFPIPTDKEQASDVTNS